MELNQRMVAVRWLRLVLALVLAGLVPALMGQGCGTSAILINENDNGNSKPPAPPVATACGLLGSACTGSLGDLPSAIVTADFDQDGDLDLAVANFGNSTVSILANDGTGVFTKTKDLTGVSNPAALAVTDVDRDAKADLAVTGTAMLAGLSVSVFRNSGNATFDAAKSFALSGVASSVISANLNPDLYPDLVTTSSLWSSVSVLLNQGNVKFSAATDLLAGTAPESVAAADIDNDGDLDLVVANRDSQTVSILKNQGSGTFLGPVAYTGGLRPRSVTVADFDGDGWVDIAVADERNVDDTTADVVVILRNQRNGTFLVLGTVAVGVNPRFVTAADVNGDGAPDLVVANYGADPSTSSLSVTLNLGNGQFAPTDFYPVGVGPVSVAVGDFNSDGHPDLAVANFSSETISLLANKGNGTFTANQ